MGILKFVEFQRVGLLGYFVFSLENIGRQINRNYVRIYFSLFNDTVLYIWRKKNVGQTIQVLPALGHFEILRRQIISKEPQP
jgi:hypothetical protein